jgi:D-alanyl-D-alanine carboxypeptidase (penicillin-binding protein 5/6)
MTEVMKKRVPARIRRNRVIASLITLGVLTLVYVVSIALTPVPPFALTQVAGFEKTFTVDASDIAWPEEPAAIGVWGGETVLANDESGPVAMASLVKLICAVVSLEVKPFEDTLDETYVLGPRDSAHIATALASNGIIAPVSEGTELSRYQMLELMLLPSANNYALSYVDWIFGSNEVFVSETRKFLERYQLDSITVVEPTGLSLENTGSAADLARFGQLALDYPVLAEIMAKKTADIPGVGVITSSNPLQDDAGVRGMKTGTTTVGRNLMLAQDFTVGSRTVTGVVVTLNQQSAEGRIEATRALAASIAANTQEISVVSDGEPVATARSWNGTEIPLVAAGQTGQVLTITETAVRTVKLNTVTAGMDAGTPVGTITVTSPAETSTISVLLAESAPIPSLWWKLTHPVELWR